MALAMRMPVSAGLSCDRVSHIDKQRPATSKASLVVKQTSALRRGLFAKQFGYVRPRSVEAAGSGGGGGGGWAGSGGDSDDSDGQGGSRGEIEALLLAAGKSLEQLPGTLQDAISKGTVSPEMIEKYLSIESSNPLLRALLKLPGFRDRMLGDDGFIAKLGIELGIGLFCKLAAEKNKRGKAFKSQIDFVCANVVMALIADFMLVWLSAPRVMAAGAAPAHRSAISKFLAACPDNAFQAGQGKRRPALEPGAAHRRNRSERRQASGRGLLRFPVRCDHHQWHCGGADSDGPGLQGAQPAAGCGQDVRRLRHLHGLLLQPQVSADRRRDRGAGHRSVCAQPCAVHGALLCRAHRQHLPGLPALGGLPPPHRPPEEGVGSVPDLGSRSPP